MIAALAVMAWRQRAHRGPWLELGLLAVVSAQALLGMLTVTRLLKPLIVTSHLLGGMTTLALLVLLWRRQRPAGPAPAVSAPLRLLAGTALATVVVQIALGGWVSRDRKSVV